LIFECWQNPSHVAVPPGLIVRPVMVRRQPWLFVCTLMARRYAARADAGEPA